MGRKSIRKSRKRLAALPSTVSTSKKRAAPFRSTVKGDETVERYPKRKRLAIVEPNSGELKQELKVWDYLVEPDDYFTARIGFHINLDAVSLLKEKLSKEQLEMFRQTCFGHFLDMPSLVFQPQIIHSLLLREVYHENDGEIWIKVSGVKLRFSIDEFAVITGLKCTGECNKLSLSSHGSKLMDKYFSGPKKVNKQSISECFMGKRWDCDEDAVKIAVLFFVHLFLLSSNNERPVNKIDFGLIDSGEYNTYPWGKEVFDVTIDSLKGKLGKRHKDDSEKAGKSYMYRLMGFPIAFQIWFYECCPYVDGKYALRVHSKVPRILNWSASEQPTFKYLQRNLFSISANKLKLRNIIPTTEEKQKLDLRGLFDKGKEKGVANDEDKDDDDDIDFTILPHEKESSSAAKSFNEYDIRKELNLVSMRQAEINKELASLKLYLENNFAKVFHALAAIAQKLEVGNNFQFSNDVPVEEDTHTKIHVEEEHEEPKDCDEEDNGRDGDDKYDDDICGDGGKDKSTSGADGGSSNDAYDGQGHGADGANAREGSKEVGEKDKDNVGESSYGVGGEVWDMMEYISYKSKKTIDKINNNIEEDEDIETMASTIISNTRHLDIQVGQLFKDKETLKKALSFYAINYQFQYKVEKSCPKSYFVTCLDEKCMWQLKASRKGKTSIFKIRKFISNHTCPSELRLNNQRQATSNIIGDLIKTKYVSMAYTPADIIRDMKDEFGVTISYAKAWRSKEKALEIMRGKPEESYALLPSYLYMLKTTNPGSVVELQRKEDKSFLYVFIALDASIKGWKYCRPTIVVDATILKATHRGTLITASTQDAAGKIFPLAFSVVYYENDASWEWFFTKFRETYGTRPGICIISDGHESIEAATRKIYPDANHCVCVFHLLNSLKTNFKINPKKIKDLFFAAARSYTIQEFDSNMAELDKVDVRIRQHLSDIGYEKWSRVHSVNNGCSTMTSNIAESLNVVNKEARDLPITPLLEYLHALTQDWSYANRNIAMSTFTKLTKKYEDMLKNNCIMSQEMKVNPIDNDLFTVLQHDKPYIVNMKERTCTCNRYQMDELPCPHALAIMNEMNLDPYEYCSIYYTKDTMVATYEAIVYPIGKKSTWNIPVDVKEELVLSPDRKLELGRPKKRRTKVGLEMLPAADGDAAASSGDLSK